MRDRLLRLVDIEEMKRHLKLGKSFSKALTTDIKRAILQNRDRILTEIRETRDLYDLLLKWGSGVQLNDNEKEFVKAQLIDICKAIPALAIFMLPFGSLVLVLLVKFLPISILPTAFNGMNHVKLQNELIE